MVTVNAAWPQQNLSNKDKKKCSRKSSFGKQTENEKMSSELLDVF